MAQNDMYVVMYKIIAYLYDCMKRGVEPDNAAWGHRALEIPESYWASIVEELVDHGFIVGVEVNHFINGKCVVSAFAPRVTMEGVAFAQENTMMYKAKAFLKDAKEVIPFI